MEKVIVVVGPTGVGKTRMGVALAKHFNGEVISGDSMQIYKTMDIGTAKVTDDEMEGIVHHLIDVKEPTESYSVKDFQDEVRLKIKEIISRGKLPIIVGGTGLYIKAALYDYEFSERVLRAIAIYESTGVKKSETLAKQNHELIYNAKFIGLTLERESLYQRIDQRVDLMMEQGLLQEIDGLMKKNYTREMQSMKAIGYKEWFAYYQGTQTLDETLELIKKNSRNYAKRQYTWFNNQVPVIWFNVNLNNFNETINAVISELEG